MTKNAETVELDRGRRVQSFSPRNLRRSSTKSHSPRSTNRGRSREHRRRDSSFRGHRHEHESRSTRTRNAGIALDMLEPVSSISNRQRSNSRSLDRPQVRIVNLRQNVICKFFQMEVCKYGDRCEWSHERESKGPRANRFPSDDLIPDDAKLTKSESSFSPMLTYLNTKTDSPRVSSTNSKEKAEEPGENLIVSPQKESKTTVEVLINGSYGGFALSELAETEYMKRKNCADAERDSLKWPKDGKKDLRDDQDLIAIHHDIGSEKMSDGISNIVLQQIPIDAQRFDAWDIDQYDGLEKVRINKEKIELNRMRQNVSSVLSFIARTLYNDRGKVSKQERLDSLRALIPETLSGDETIDSRNAIQTMLSHIDGHKAVSQQNFTDIQRVRHRDHLIDFPAILKDTHVNSKVSLLMTHRHIKGLNKIYNEWNGARRRTRIDKTEQYFSCRLDFKKIERGWKVKTANTVIELPFNALIRCRLNLFSDEVMDIVPIVVSGQIKNITVKREIFVFSDIVELVAEAGRLDTIAPILTTSEIKSVALSNLQILPKRRTAFSSYVVFHPINTVFSGRGLAVWSLHQKVAFNLKLSDTSLRTFRVNAEGGNVFVQAYNLQAV